MSIVPAEEFKAMASRIERNDPKEFAGAFMIVSPDGTVLSHAFFNPVGDAPSFWGFVSAAVQTASTEAIQKAEGQLGIGVRRQY